MVLKIINMKVINQYIVHENSKWQILFQCEDGEYYITTNGAFGQRDMYIIHCGIEEAVRLISEPKLIDFK